MFSHIFLISFVYVISIVMAGRFAALYNWDFIVMQSKVNREKGYSPKINKLRRWARNTNS